jgi:hypothetical protein
MQAESLRVSNVNDFFEKFIKPHRNNCIIYETPVQIFYYLQDHFCEDSIVYETPIEIILMFIKPQKRLEAKTQGFINHSIASNIE